MEHKIQTLLHDFPPTTRSDWETVVEQSLSGRAVSSLRKTRPEGFEIDPLYTEHPIPTAHTQPPDHPPYVRGRATLARRQAGWDIRQSYDCGTISDVTAAISDDLQRGVTSFWLQPVYATNSPVFGPEGGLSLFVQQEWRDLLRSVDLTVTPVSVATGAYVLPVLALLTSVAEERGMASASLMGSIYADPLGTSASQGQLPDHFDSIMHDVATAISWTQTQTPHLQVLCCSGLPYHDAGAHAVQELAYIIATAVTYIRKLQTCGLSMDTIAASTFVQIGIESSMFLSVAKIRALRLLWAKVIKACGGSSASQQVFVHACTSRISTAKRDPWVNLLRNTTEGFSAAVAGADALTITPFDRCLGIPEPIAYRLASHTQLILAHEAHVGRVIDPAGGSWYVEHLTDTMAREAWKLFQQIETLGGMDVALSSGHIAKSIAQTVAQKSKDIARRKIPILGVSEYANLTETPLAREVPKTPDFPALASLEQLSPLVQTLVQATSDHDQMISLQQAARQGFSVFDLFHSLHPQANPIMSPHQTNKKQAQGASEHRLWPYRGAAMWETLRNQSDAYVRQHGHLPRVFLANLGSVSAHKARTDFTQRFLAAGGFEAISPEGLASHDDIAHAYAHSGAQAVVLCGTDASYEESVTSLTPMFTMHPPKFIALAGKPGANETRWREAGVTHFLFLGCDVLALLQEWQRMMGVIA